MARREFIVLYTHQKRKKAKVWQDGVLKVNDQGSKAVLYGEGNKRLDHVHIKPDQANVGEELESEKYLITIEEVKKDDALSTVTACEAGNVQQKTECKPQILHNPAPVQAIRRHPLKRKRTGFVPPRQIVKKASPEKDDSSCNTIRASHRTLSSCGSPRQLSSLFSNPYGQKDSAVSRDANAVSVHGSHTGHTSLGKPASTHIQTSTLHCSGGSVQVNQSSDMETSFPRSPEVVSAFVLGASQDCVPSDARQDPKHFRTSSDSAAHSDDDTMNSHIPSTTSHATADSPGRDSHHTLQLSDHPSHSTSSAEGTEDTATASCGVSAFSAPKGKRSATQILALLGKGKRPFQPPLKQTAAIGKDFTTEPDVPISNSLHCSSSEMEKHSLPSVVDGSVFSSLMGEKFTNLYGNGTTCSNPQIFMGGVNSLQGKACGDNLQRYEVDDTFSSNCPNEPRNFSIQKHSEPCRSKTSEQRHPSNVASPANPSLMIRKYSFSTRTGLKAHQSTGMTEKQPRGYESGLDAGRTPPILLSLCKDVEDDRAVEDTTEVKRQDPSEIEDRHSSDYVAHASSGGRGMLRVNYIESDMNEQSETGETLHGSRALKCQDNSPVPVKCSNDCNPGLSVGTEDGSDNGDITHSGHKLDSLARKTSKDSISSEMPDSLSAEERSDVQEGKQLSESVMYSQKTNSREDEWHVVKSQDKRDEFKTSIDVQSSNSEQENVVPERNIEFQDANSKEEIGRAISHLGNNLPMAHIVNQNEDDNNLEEENLMHDRELQPASLTVPQTLCEYSNTAMKNERFFKDRNGNRCYTSKVKFQETAGEIDNSTVEVKEVRICNRTGESDFKNAPRSVGDIRPDNVPVNEDKLTFTLNDRMACQTFKRNLVDNFANDIECVHDGAVIQDLPANIAIPQDVNTSNHNEVQSVCTSESSSVVMPSTGNDPNGLDAGKLPAVPQLFKKSRMFHSEVSCDDVYTEGETSHNNDKAHLKEGSASHGSVLPSPRIHPTQEVNYQTRRSTGNKFARKVNGGPPQEWKSIDRNAHEADGSNTSRDNQERVVAKMQMSDEPLFYHSLGKSNFPSLNDDSQLSSVASVDTYDFSQDTQNCDCSVSTPDNKLELPMWNRYERESLQTLSQDTDAVVPDIAAQHIDSPSITIHMDSLSDHTELNEDVSIVNISDTEQSVPEMKESCHCKTGDNSGRRDMVPDEVDFEQRVKSNSRVTFLQTLDISLSRRGPPQESQEIDTDVEVLPSPCTPSDDILWRNEHKNLSQAFEGELACDHPMTRNKESAHLDSQIAADATTDSTVNSVKNITNSLKVSDDQDGYPAAARSEKPFQALSGSHIPGHNFVPRRFSHTREHIAKGRYPTVESEGVAYVSGRGRVAMATTQTFCNELELNGAEYAVKAYQAPRTGQSEEDFLPSQEIAASVKQPDHFHAWMHGVPGDSMGSQVTSEEAFLCEHGLAKDPPKVVWFNPDAMNRNRKGKADEIISGQNQSELKCLEPKCLKPNYLKPEKHQSTILVLPHPSNLRRPLMKRNTGTVCQEKLSSKLDVSPRNEISWKQFKSSETVQRHCLPVMMSKKCTRDDKDKDHRVVHQLLEETTRLGDWHEVPSHHIYPADENSGSLSYAAVHRDEAEAPCRSSTRGFNVEDTLWEESTKLFQERMGIHQIDDLQWGHHSTDLCRSDCIPSASASAWFFPVSSQASTSELCMNNEQSDCTATSKRCKNCSDDHFPPTVQGDQLHSGTQNVDEQIPSPLFRSQHDCKPAPQPSCYDVLHLYSSRQPDFIRPVNTEDLLSRSSSCNLNDSMGRVVLNNVPPKLQPLSQTFTPVCVIESSQDHASRDVNFLDSVDKVPEVKEIFKEKSSNRSPLLFPRSQSAEGAGCPAYHTPCLTQCSFDKADTACRQQKGPVDPDIKVNRPGPQKSAILHDSSTCCNVAHMQQHAVTQNVQPKHSGHRPVPSTDMLSSTNVHSTIPDNESDIQCQRAFLGCEVSPAFDQPASDVTETMSNKKMQENPDIFSTQLEVWEYPDSKESEPECSSKFIGSLDKMSSSQCSSASLSESPTFKDGLLKTPSQRKCPHERSSCQHTDSSESAGVQKRRHVQILRCSTNAQPQRRPLIAQPPDESVNTPMPSIFKKLNHCHRDFVAPSQGVSPNGISLPTGCGLEAEESRSSPCWHAGNIECGTLERMQHSQRGTCDSDWGTACEDTRDDCKLRGHDENRDHLMDSTGDQCMDQSDSFRHDASQLLDTYDVVDLAFLCDNVENFHPSDGFSGHYIRDTTIAARPLQDSIDLGTMSQAQNVEGNTGEPMQALHSSNRQLPRPSCLVRQACTSSLAVEKPLFSRQTTTQLAKVASKSFRTPVIKELASSNMAMSGELRFPPAATVKSSTIPQRRVLIPVSFPNVATYKQVLLAAVKEHLNIILFEVAHRYHSCMAKADVTPYTRCSGGQEHGSFQASGSGEAISNPLCKHGQPAKMVCVKKEGPNKGRMFYACNNPRENQCKFFLWADQHAASSGKAGGASPVPPSQRERALVSLIDATSVEKFTRTHRVHLYCESHLTKRSGLSQRMLPGAPPYGKRHRGQQIDNGSKKMYLKLHRKEHSSTYAKDDLWIISQDLTFDPGCSFTAKSVYHGPSSSDEIEIEPLTGYSPSNWPSGCTVYGILASNVSSELTYLDNIQDFVTPRSFPILPHLISGCDGSVPSASDRKYSLHGQATKPAHLHQLNVTPERISDLVNETIVTYHLNEDQAVALQQIAAMLSTERDEDGSQPPITLVHGVFGAGKSYLLAVTILLLVQLFAESESNDAGTQATPWKVLVSSTTNVAVDRILLGLLDLGFENFIRVGSMRKIAKPVLPFSVHASDKENQEMKELQMMLKDDLSSHEKQLVRKSIERHRLGKNKEMMAKVKVVGVTCAACTFPCIKNLTFPVVLLDESSQMTEPASLLPLARFGCEKLVLVGDPHQLDPTIQGSESSHTSGLEQTLFDRLSLMGYDPIMLRTQYRCHPSISALANSLFYGNQLLDGVLAEDRPPLVNDLPTLCFFNVSHGQEKSARDGSYFNDAEANFVVFLIGGLIEMGVAPSEVGVITLYKAQVNQINTLLQTSSNRPTGDLRAIQISTVDAFQGGEKAIIILSCVRTQRVGFIDSDKRTNVALTRSKNHLLIVGGMKMLSENSLWGKIIHKCHESPSGVMDSRAFLKQWQERLAEVRVDMETGEEKVIEMPRKKTRRKEDKEETGGVLIDVIHSPSMSLSEDDDFVESSSCSRPSPVPFDASTPLTPIHPVETSPTPPNHTHRTFHSPEPGDVPPQTVIEGTSKDIIAQDFKQDSNEPSSVTSPAFSSTEKTCSNAPSHGSGHDTSSSTAHTNNSSISYSPLQEVVESDSDESNDDLPNFGIGDILL